VIEVGQDPRRFAEDLLRRLRDLVIVAAVPDALTSGLVDVAPDQAERLASQAAALGAGELTRAAEVIATGLTDMRGTTAPRLHLELMCARVLLPGTDVVDRGIHARLDRLERRLGVTGSVNPSAPPKPQTQPEQHQPAHNAPAGSVTSPSPVPETKSSQPPQPPPQPPPDESQKQEAQGPGLTVTDIRRLWPEVLEEVKGKRRFTWILLSQNAQVAELRNGMLLLAMSNAGARDSFARGGNEDVLREAMVVVMGADFGIETMVDPSAAPNAPASNAPAVNVPVPHTQSPATQPRAPTRPTPDSAKVRATNGARHDHAEDPDSVASRDDRDLEEDPESQTELLARHLGAEIIAEEDHGA
jgi:DNA polymerase-3 subunit gamma/tau